MQTSTQSTLAGLFTTAVLLVVVSLLPACTIQGPVPEAPDSEPTLPSPTDLQPADLQIVPAGKEKRDQAIQALLLSESSPLTSERVGYYMDVLFANLQQNLNDDMATTVRHGNAITITFPNSSMFAKSRAEISRVAGDALGLIAGVLAEYNKTLIVVEGHTDNRGDADFNQLLSEQRALAVGQYLAAHNIASKRILVSGLGSTRPASSNNTAAGQARNRRVEITLQPVIAE